LQAQAYDALQLAGGEAGGRDGAEEGQRDGPARRDAGLEIRELRTSKTDTSMRSPAPSVRSLTSVVVPLASASERETAATAAGLAAGDDGTAAVGPVGCDRPAHDVNASTAPMVTPQNTYHIHASHLSKAIEWRRGYEPHPDG